MTNSPTVVRSLLIYAICLPLALILGYLLSNPLQWSSFGPMVGLFLILSLPLFLRFHHPLLVFGWNVSMIVFFLPGAPRLWMPLVAISLIISIARRAIDQQYRFLSVPTLTWPLLVLAAVVLITAEATGGIGLRSLGNEVYGGKRYFFMLGAIVGYFALTAQRVPPKRALLYLGLFLLGGITIIIGDVLYFESSILQWVFLFFPPNIGANETSTGILRFSGMYSASSLFFFFMLAKYGIRGIFSMAHPFRFGFLVLFFAGSLLGGFRSALITLALIFCLQFICEGLYRTRLLPVFLFCFLTVGVITAPFVNRLPSGVQRTLSVIPWIPVNPDVRANADASSEWRLNIWKAVLPQIPHYLLMGKGLALSTQDYDYSLNTFTGAMHEFSQEYSWAALAGDYHNGPLSVIIPFGIWGVAAFIWLLAAGCRVLYRNFRYGDPNLRTINAFLLATYIAKIIVFCFIFGSFHVDLQIFVGYLAMSVILNGGVAEPEPGLNPEPVAATPPVAALRRAYPAYSRRA